MPIKVGGIAKRRDQDYMDAIKPLYDRALKMTEIKSQQNLRRMEEWLK